MTRMGFLSWTIVLLGLLALPLPAAVAGEPSALPWRVAVLDFELVDTSIEGESRGVDPAETARLKLISELLRDLLNKSGRYKVLDLTPAAAKIAEAKPIHGCNGCETDIAASIGADRVMSSVIRKVSTLILAITIMERNVKTGEVVQVATAQIRGDTDESWTHGVTWLVHNRLLAQR